MRENSTEMTFRDDVLRMVADVVSAYVSRNPLSLKQVSEVINSVYLAFGSLGGEQKSTVSEPPRPAVSIRKSMTPDYKSMTPDYLICLEDGKKLKMLKRHLRTVYNMTPNEYRTKWGLPADYPMVAPNYAIQRSNFAKQIGLGRKAKS